MESILEGTEAMRIIKNLSLIKATDIYFRVMREEKAVQDEAVRLNTSQMKDDFMNSDGVLLSDIGGNYSPFTMSKGRKKSPSSVDLYDTGEFHESFRVQNVTSTGFDIVSNSVKSDGTDLKVEWGPEIEGLTEAHQVELAEFILDYFFGDIMKYLNAA